MLSSSDYIKVSITTRALFFSRHFLHLLEIRIACIVHVDVTAKLLLLGLGSSLPPSSGLLKTGFPDKGSDLGCVLPPDMKLYHNLDSMKESLSVITNTRIYKLVHYFYGQILFDLHFAVWKVAFEIIFHVKFLWLKHQ